MFKQHSNDNYEARFGELEKKIDYIEKQNSELLWASYFRDSIVSSSWVKDKSFSATNGAASYSFLYKLFKIYEILQPSVIVEFGLGQSTNLTRQYCSANSRSLAIVVDHDDSWVKTYQKFTKGIDNLSLKILPTEDFELRDGAIGAKDTQYKGVKKVLARSLGNKKLNLVIVDGPIGVDKEYSRTDILGLTGDLADRFVVIIDDSNRTGEQNTIKILRDELNKVGVNYADWTVNGMKQQTIFASSDIADILWAV